MAAPVREGDTHGTVPKVAAHLGITEPRLRDAIAAGKVRVYREPLGAWPKVCIAEVERWMRANGITSSL